MPTQYLLTDVGRTPMSRNIWSATLPPNDLDSDPDRGLLQRRPTEAGRFRPAPESVWDYPRPPVVVPSRERVVIELDGEIVADTHRSFRALETSHLPVYYVPVEAVPAGFLVPVPGTTWCEFKGSASYFDVVTPSGRVIPRAAWHYPQPTAGFEQLLSHVAFYPGLMDRCTIDDETVITQEGDFYGGWITSAVTGPFKGAPGTRGW